MVDRIEAARREIDAASDETDHEYLREQLRSLSEGLREVENDDDPQLQGDRLEQVEAKLTGLADDTEDAPSEGVLERLETARDEIDAYRRDKAQDWA